jgi:hypothetical protein
MIESTVQILVGAAIIAYVGNMTLKALRTGELPLRGDRKVSRWEYPTTFWFYIAVLAAMVAAFGFYVCLNIVHAVNELRS